MARNDFFLRSNLSPKGLRDRRIAGLATDASGRKIGMLDSGAMAEQAPFKNAPVLTLPTSARAERVGLAGLSPEAAQASTGLMQDGNRVKTLDIGDGQFVAGAAPAPSPAEIEKKKQDAAAAAARSATGLSAAGLGRSMAGSTNVEDWSTQAQTSPMGRYYSRLQNTNPYGQTPTGAENDARSYMASKGRGTATGIARYSQAEAGRAAGQQRQAELDAYTQGEKFKAQAMGLAALGRQAGEPEPYVNSTPGVDPITGQPVPGVLNRRTGQIDYAPPPPSASALPTEKNDAGYDVVITDDRRGKIGSTKAMAQDKDGKVVTVDWQDIDGKTYWPFYPTQAAQAPSKAQAPTFATEAEAQAALAAGKIKPGQEVIINGQRMRAQ